MTQGYLFKPCCEYNKGLRQTHHSVTQGHLVQQIISNITTNMTHIHIHGDKDRWLVKDFRHASFQGQCSLLWRRLRLKGTKCGSVFDVLILSAPMLIVMWWKCARLVYVRKFHGGMRSTVQSMMSLDWLTSALYIYVIHCNCDLVCRSDSVDVTLCPQFILENTWGGLDVC